MVTSESIKSISAALVGFHKEVGKIGKDASNPFFKSKYASLSNILEGIAEPLTNNGLAIVQFPEGENGLTTRLVHVSGEWMESTYNMRSVKDTPQDRGSAITYQRRYAVGAILSLNIDEDDDANSSSGRTVQLQKAKPALAQQKEGYNDNAFEQWEQELSKCKTLEDIGVLYRKNALTVDNNAAIKNLFAARKTALTQKQSA